jgi:hypothetical protein
MDDGPFCITTYAHIVGVVGAETLRKNDDGTYDLPMYWHGPPLSPEDLELCLREDDLIDLEVGVLDADDRVVLAAVPAVRAAPAKRSDPAPARGGGVVTPLRQPARSRQRKELAGYASEATPLWRMSMSMAAARMLAEALSATIRMHDLSEEARKKRMP